MAAAIAARSNAILYLSDADLTRLALAPADILAAVEDGLRLDRADIVAVPKLNLPIAAGHFLQAMPAAARSLGLAAIKWTGVVAANANRGIPNVNALIVVSALDDGRPVAVMTGNRITALRTAAMSAAAARRLARPASEALAFIGTGVQAASHLAALRPLFPRLTRAYLFGRGVASRERLADAVRACGLAPVAVPRAQDAIEPADVVITSVPAAPGLAPFIDGAWLKPGAFASMVDLGRSWRSETLGVIDIVATDDREQSDAIAAEGKLARAGPWAADLADLVSGRHPGRGAASQRTAFIFAGIALCDLAVAAMALRRARAERVGTWLSA